MDLPEDLERCVAFHGHLCPGVVIGYCAAKLGMRELATARAEDEELIAIVENDTCAVDAVQVLTGCTFGKGNLYFRDYGKMVFTFARRSDNRSLRLYLRPADTRAGGAVPEQQRRRRRIESMLACDPSEIFDVKTDALTSLPAPARFHESMPCQACGELVMVERLQREGSRSVCMPCHATIEESQ